MAHARRRLRCALNALPRLQLRRTDLSAHNCLLSINDDARFVARLAALFPGLPLVANLRCGLWYTPSPNATAYFKARSTPRGCARAAAMTIDYLVSF